MKLEKPESSYCKEPNRSESKKRGARMKEEAMTSTNKREYLSFIFVLPSPSTSFGFEGSGVFRYEEAKAEGRNETGRSGQKGRE